MNLIASGRICSRSVVCGSMLVALLLLAGAARAQEGVVEEDRELVTAEAADADLAKQSQNPVGDLISLPAYGPPSLRSPEQLT